jgi:hypothetical protein
MRCICCDKILSDFEATRKSINTEEYLDMCNKCYATVSDQLLSYERNDLYDEEDEYYEDLDDSDFTSQKKLDYEE